MNVTHNLSTCKSESIKIIRFIDIFNIDTVPSLWWYDHMSTTGGGVDILFYTSPSSDLWFLYYFTKRRKSQKENYLDNKINFGQFQTRGAFNYLKALYFIKESVNSFNILFITFNVRTLLGLLSNDASECLSLRINKNDNNQKQRAILETLGCNENKDRDY